MKIVMPMWNGSSGVLTDKSVCNRVSAEYPVMKIVMSAWHVWRKSQRISSGVLADRNVYNTVSTEESCAVRNQQQNMKAPLSSLFMYFCKP